MSLVNGEVRKLDPATGLIVLRHSDIPNLAMPAMTMGFEIADKKMLEGFKGGDKVRLQAEMVNGNAVVAVGRIPIMRGRERCSVDFGLRGLHATLGFEP